MDGDTKHSDLIQRLRLIAGRRNVIVRTDAIRRYCTGFRFGFGAALAVVRPGTLVEQWRVMQLCAAARVIVIVQAANTGLTGGSTPHGAYDRPVVLINTTRLRGIHLIEGGAQVVCLPGATLFDLERTLKPIGRAPHSVIGSSCIGASVLGGVCNNSGGSLIRRGPAYTELAIYAQIDADGSLHLVNHLGINLGDAPETMLDRLEHAAFDAAAVEHDPARRASDDRYATHVRDIAADTPARFNADARCLFEASGSAGRIMLFAVRLDTFPEEGTSTVFYLGTNEPDNFTDLRRTALTDFTSLPIAAEYIHRTAFDIASQYGKDMFVAIRLFGTDRLPLLFSLKAKIDICGERLRLGRGLGDRLLHGLGKLLPRHLPSRMLEFRDRFEHHLIIRVANDGVCEMRAYLAAHLLCAEADFFECSASEASAAFLHRFVVAGAATRFRTVHAREVEDIVALDIALPRNAVEWVERLPHDLEREMLHRLYYGHFFCYVFHQDYIITKGADPLEIEHRMWKLLDKRGAEYPAEHNVGHLYRAKPELSRFYRELDPTNQLNPGIGQTSRSRHWVPDADPLPAGGENVERCL
jgi:D-lactate dehydrogenase